MSQNKVIKSISFNKTNKADEPILKKIEQEGFNFSGWAKKAMLDAIKREQTVVKKTRGGGISIKVGGMTEQKTPPPLG